MIPTVWIVSARDGQDFEPATVYGELKPITKDRVNVFDLETMIDLIHNRLKTSRPMDHLLLAGSPVLNALCVIEMLHRHGRVNLLIWHHNLKEYKPRSLEMNVGADSTEALIRALTMGAEA